MKKKARGHFCWVCRRNLPNERFSGSGHRDHVCKQCRSAQRRERRAASERAREAAHSESGPASAPTDSATEGTWSLRGASFDVASIRREIDYMVSRARAGEGHLVTLGPLLFFSTSTGDAWMLDPSDAYAACLARDSVQQPLEIADRGEQFAIAWQQSYRIEGQAMVFVEHATGRERTVLGYPCSQLEAAARRIAP